MDISVPSAINAFLISPDVSEIMVNGPNEIFVEQGGKITRAEKRFADEADLLRVVRHLLSSTGKSLSPQTPLIDTRLQDGSRMTVTTPPVTATTTFTIRRSTQQIKTLHELVQRGALSTPMADYLRQAVKARKNILIAGGTSSGKTTVLNVLAGEIPAEQRIVTIEDTFEISLVHPNRVSMETVLNTREDQRVDMRILVAHALHLRPDRILLGECRSGEALDILQAMNSGHDGCMATIHASSSADVISRLETLVLMAGYEIPLMAIRQQIARALHVIVQARRTVEGHRQVCAITEVGALENGQVALKDIFTLTGDVIGDPEGYRPAGNPISLNQQLKIDPTLRVPR